MEKWEYCVVKGIFTSTRGLIARWPAIWYFLPDGIKVVEIKKDEEKELASAIAGLGEEGWEMVGAGSLNEGNTHLIYFKRPKAD